MERNTRRGGCKSVTSSVLSAQANNSQICDISYRIYGKYLTMETLTTSARSDTTEQALKVFVDSLNSRSSLKVVIFSVLYHCELQHLWLLDATCKNFGCRMLQYAFFPRRFFWPNIQTTNPWSVMNFLFRHSWSPEDES